MIPTMYENHFAQLDGTVIADNLKILLFIDEYPAHSKNMFFAFIQVMFLSHNCTRQLQPLDLGIIHAFICYYRQQFT